MATTGGLSRQAPTVTFGETEEEGIDAALNSVSTTATGTGTTTSTTDAALTTA